MCGGKIPKFNQLQFVLWPVKSNSEHECNYFIIKISVTASFNTLQFSVSV